MHRFVFTMIVMLSVDLLSLRLSGVLEVGTSVGWRCSTIVGEDLSVVLCVWSLAIGGMSIGAVASSYLARGTSQNSWLFVLLVPQEPPLIVSFVVSLVL